VVVLADLREPLADPVLHGVVHERDEAQLGAPHSRLTPAVDGIEQIGLDNLDEFEDTVDTLFRSTSDTQFVSTSQVLMHRLPSEARLKLGGLGKEASRTLLVQSCNGDGDSIYGREDGLLDFCDGHTLTIRLAGALTMHYGSTAAALDAMCNRGIESAPEESRFLHGATLCMGIGEPITIGRDHGRRSIDAIQACTFRSQYRRDRKAVPAAEIEHSGPSRQSPDPFTHSSTTNV
jgi:hypothetical protein